MPDMSETKRKQRKKNADKVRWLDQGWQPVFIGFCPSQKAWDREMKRLGITPPEPYPTTAGRMTTFDYKGSKTVCLVTIQDGSEKEHSLSEVIGLLVHEAMHVWQRILLDIGEHDGASMELEAYAMQQIVMMLMNAFEETRGLPKA